MDFKFIINYAIANLKKQNDPAGFTLIELLVVILIVSILSLVALPSFIGQVGNARESEAKATLSSISKAQQVYYYERSIFADTLDKLEVALKGKYYEYPDPTLVENNTIKHIATRSNTEQSIRDYGMGIYRHSNGSYTVLLCQSEAPGSAVEAPDTDTNTCTSGSLIQ